MGCFSRVWKVEIGRVKDRGACECVGRPSKSKIKKKRIIIIAIRTPYANLIEFDDCLSTPKQTGCPRDREERNITIILKKKFIKKDERSPNGLPRERDGKGKTIVLRSTIRCLQTKRNAIIFHAQ